MQTCIGYIKVKKIFRRHWREVYTPVYKDLGHGSTPDKKTDKKTKANLQ